MSSRSYVILVIEDGATDRRIYRRYLEEQKSWSFEVIEAATAQAGIEACARHTPDCILLDFKLPDRDGLRAIPDLQKITRAPILLLTGHLGPSTQTEAYRAGVSHYLSKDFLSSESLLAAVADALGIHRAGTGAEAGTETGAGSKR
jgi:CheY-like chemotaxis protein